jgi:hypothetical protein
MRFIPIAREYTRELNHPVSKVWDIAGRFHGVPRISIEEKKEECECIPE